MPIVQAAEKQNGVAFVRADFPPDRVRGRERSRFDPERHDANEGARAPVVLKGGSVDPAPLQQHPQIEEPLLLRRAEEQVRPAEREVPRGPIVRLDAFAERLPILKIFHEERVVPVDGDGHMGRGQEEIARGVSRDERGAAIADLGMERLRSGRRSDDRHPLRGRGLGRVVRNEEADLEVRSQGPRELQSPNPHPGHARANRLGRQHDDSSIHFRPRNFSAQTWTRHAFVPSIARIRDVSRPISP